MTHTNTWLRGRKFRHGFRLEGDFIKREYGKDHLFFQSAEVAQDFMEKELESRLETKKRIDP